MKKAILLAIMMGLPALGGQPGSTSPAPEPAAPAASPWGVEMGAAYYWAGMQEIGGDITAVYRVSRHSAFTLRIGYSWGGDKVASDLDLSGVADNQELQHIFTPMKRELRDSGESPQPNEASALLAETPEWNGHVGIWTKTRVHAFNLMPGYRYTGALTQRLSLFGGVNAGISSEGIKFGVYYDHDRLLSAHDTAWGFAYSAEAGLSYAVTPTVDVFASCQFRGNTAKCRLRTEYGSSTATRYVYFGLRAGVGFRF